jgi:hypothetical protein
MSVKSVAMFLLSCLSLSVFLGESNADGNSNVQVTFYAMGDVPYAAEEDILLSEQIFDLPGDAEFVIHVGDIKRGLPLCTEGVYRKVAEILGKSAAPVFIIPGDNEWNDCIDPAQAWKYWDQYFMRFDQRWKHGLLVERQKIREENFAFVKNQVLFVGLNIVGGRVHEEQEWKLRHAGDLDWVKSSLQRFGNKTSRLVIFGHAKPAKVHDDFFEPFNKVAEEFGKPILYLHGDGHKWIYDRPFKAKNILRVEVDQGGKAPPVKVQVTNHPTEPFVFDRRNGKKAS